MPHQKTLIALFLIILISFTLRFWNLETVPDGFQEDEASLGYNAYSILKTGSDEYGVKFPLYIDAFGDFRPALHFYLVIPSILAFGNTISAVRFPSALLGALTPLIVFFLVKKIYRSPDNKIAILSSFLVAISPWHITLSRASNDAVIALFFLLIGFYFFTVFLFSKRIVFAILSILFFFLSMNTYHTPRLFIPLLVLISLFFFQKEWFHTKKQMISTCLFFLATTVLSLSLIFAIPGGTGRASQVSIFTTPDERLILEEQIREDGGIPAIITRTTHNKVINYGLRLLSNYSNYFTLDYLGLKGGLPLWYQVPNMGLFYLIEIPFLLIGGYLAVKNKRTALLFLIWFLVGPIVASTTLDDIPNVQRSLFMIPPAQALVAVGLIAFFNSAGRFKPPAIGLTFLLFVLNSYYFTHQYFHHSRLHKPWHRNNGFVELAKAIPQYLDKFDKIIITQGGGSVYNHILYFTKVDPEYFLSLKLNMREEIWGFDKYVFAKPNCPLDRSGNVLFVCRGEWETPPKFEEMQVIKRTDGTPAFKLIREDPRFKNKKT